MDPVNQHSAGLLVYKNIYTLHCVWLPSQRCLSGMMQRMRWSLTMCWLWFLGSTSTTTSRTAVEILLKKVAIWSVGVLGGSSSSVFKGGDYWSSLSPTRENRWVDSIRRKAICRQCCKPAHAIHREPRSVRFFVVSCCWLRGKKPGPADAALLVAQANRCFSCY